MGAIMVSSIDRLLRSFSMALSMPGYWTFTATRSPPWVTARWTWPTLAAAKGRARGARAPSRARRARRDTGGASGRGPTRGTPAATGKTFAPDATDAAEGGTVPLSLRRPLGGGEDVMAAVYASSLRAVHK